ncbi:MAG: hypothetical protein WCH39_28655 [Schlesneria sp.]
METVIFGVDRIVTHKEPLCGSIPARLAVWKSHKTHWSDLTTPNMVYIIFGV